MWTFSWIHPKTLPWLIDNNTWARQNNITVHNVLLFKEPISFFYSFWKRGVPIQKAKKNEFFKYYKRFLQTGLPFIVLGYNRLVEEPAATQEKLCGLLNIPYFPGKERFWEKQHHHLFGSIGTRKQAEALNSQIRKQEVYPQEFKKIIPIIDAETAKDHKFQDILSNLHANEMRSTGCISDDTIHKPYWYYFLKAKQKGRRWCPEKWKYNQ